LRIKRVYGFTTYETSGGLIRPWHPQTNGMVERFNRRLTEAIRAQPALPGHGSKKFASHDERDAFVHYFVANYNRTRLKCLGYKAPIEMLLIWRNSTLGQGSRAVRQPIF